MAQAVIMPRQGISVESCVIIEWKKKEGDPVKVGDVLFVYETDKAVFEEEATFEGTFLKKLYDEGDDVVCLENVCIIGDAGEDISALVGGGDATNAEEKVVEEAPKAEATMEPAQPTVPQPTTEDGRLMISPRAKNLADKSHADLSYAVATGPEGRIIERDVMELIKNGQKVNANVGTAPAATPVVSTDVHAYDEVKLSNMRKIIAKSMHESLAQMAQLTHNASFDATNILALRKEIKKRSAEVGNITLNDMVLYAVSRTLMQHPDVNAHFTGESIRRFHHANIGVAVDVERGLMVPTVFGADAMTLGELSTATKAVVDQARTGQISPDLLTGGTFTVSNLGTMGVESFTPVINPPQTAILGVCTVVTRLKPDGTSYPAMGLSLTFDHRAVDGAPAARYLRDLCDYLENFSTNLAIEAVKGR